MDIIYVCPAACLSGYLSACMSVCPSVRPSVRSSVFPLIRAYIRPTVHSSIRPSVGMSVRLSAVHLSNRPSVHPFVRVPFPSVSLPTICPSVLQYVCPIFRPPIDRLPVRLYEHTSFCLFVCPSVRPSAKLFACLPVCIFAVTSDYSNCIDH